MRYRKGEKLHRGRDHPIRKRGWEFKAQAVFFSFIFASSMILGWPPRAPAQIHSVPPAGEIRIPEELGVVEEIYQAKPRGEKSSLVVYIQDAHCIYDAQSSIRKIIDKMQKDHGLGLVALEGGTGKIDPLLFRSFPIEEVKEKVIEGYVTRGELSGAEWASIVNERQSGFWGIEEMKVYRENKEAFLKAASEKERIDARLDDIEKHLVRIKDQIYSLALKDLYQKAEDYEEGKLNLLDYVKYLRSLVSPSSGEYPMMDSLLQAMEREKGIPMSQVEAEGVMLVREIERVLKPENEAALREFRERISASKRGEIKRENYYVWLQGRAKEAGVLKEAEGVTGYPTFMSYVRHVEEMEKIKGEALFDEIDALVSRVKEKLFQNERQKRLDLLFKHLRILRQLAGLELSRDELAYYRSHESEFEEREFWDFTGERPVGGELDDLFKPHRAFYDIALKRDEILYRNLKDLLEREDRKMAVLITGGFHSKGIKEKLKREGISYLSIIPRITRFEEESPYWDVMEGRVSYADRIRSKALAPELFLLMQKEAAQEIIPEQFETELAKLLAELPEAERRRIQEKVERWRQLLRKIKDQAVIGQLEEVFSEYLMDQKRESEEAITRAIEELDRLKKTRSLTSEAVLAVLKKHFPYAEKVVLPRIVAEAASLGRAERTPIKMYLETSDRLRGLLRGATIQNFSQEKDRIQKDFDFLKDQLVEVERDYTDNNTVSQSVYERVVNLLFRSARSRPEEFPQSFDLALITLPVGPANTLGGTDLGSELKRMMIEEIRELTQAREGELRIQEEEGSNQAFSGTRLVVLGLSAREIEGKVMKEIFGKVKEDLKKKVSAEKAPEIEGLKIFAGLTTIGKGDKIRDTDVIDWIGSMMDQKRGKEASQEVEELIVRKVKEVTARAQLQEHLRGTQGIYTEVQLDRPPPDVEWLGTEKEWRELVLAAQNKYIPQNDFRTGFLPRPAHDIGRVKGQGLKANRHGKGLEKLLWYRDEAIRASGENNPELLSENLRALKEEYEKWLPLYDLLVLRSLQDVRYKNSYKLESGITKIVAAEQDGSLDDLLRRLEEASRSERLEKAVREEMQTARAGVGKGFYMTKLGDEIGLVYRLKDPETGKATQWTMAFFELDGFNRFNEIYWPDKKDNFYHAVLEAIHKWARDHRVAQGVDPTKNKDLLSLVKQEILNTWVTLDDPMYEKGIKLRRADGEPIPVKVTRNGIEGVETDELLKGDKVRIGDLIFDHTRKTKEGERFPAYESKEAKEGEEREVFIIKGMPDPLYKIGKAKAEKIVVVGKDDEIKEDISPSALMPVVNTTGATGTFDPEKHLTLFDDQGRLIGLEEHFYYLGRFNGEQKKFEELKGEVEEVKDIKARLAAAASLGEAVDFGLRVAGISAPEGDFTLADFVRFLNRSSDEELRQFYAELRGKASDYFDRAGDPENVREIAQNLGKPQKYSPDEMVSVLQNAGIPVRGNLAAFTQRVNDLVSRISGEVQTEAYRALLRRDLEAQLLQEYEKAKEKAKEKAPERVRGSIPAFEELRRLTLENLFGKAQVEKLGRFRDEVLKPEARNIMEKMEKERTSSIHQYDLKTFKSRIPDAPSLLRELNNIGKEGKIVIHINHDEIAEFNAFRSHLMEGVKREGGNPTEVTAKLEKVIRPRGMDIRQSDISMYVKLAEKFGAGILYLSPENIEAFKRAITGNKLEADAEAVEKFEEIRDFLGEFIDALDIIPPGKEGEVLRKRLVDEYKDLGFEPGYDGIVLNLKVLFQRITQEFKAVMAARVAA